MQLSVVHNVLMIGPPGVGNILLAGTIADLGGDSIRLAYLTETLQYQPRVI
jgi:ATP-dependent protease Clp ATPase subunit